MAKYKGFLETSVRAAGSMRHLKDGDRFDLGIPVYGETAVDTSAYDGGDHNPCNQPNCNLMHIYPSPAPLKIPSKM